MSTPAWQALSRMEGPGYHYEFAAAAIVALQRGLPLAAIVQAHPALASFGERAPVGAVVRACLGELPLDPGPFELYVAGRLWVSGDAFDVGREFYALVGFNQAPAAAWEALEKQGGASGLLSAVDKLSNPLPEEI